MAGVIRIEIHWNKEFTKIKLDLIFTLKNAYRKKYKAHTIYDFPS